MNRGLGSQIVMTLVNRGGLNLSQLAIALDYPLDDMEEEGKLLQELDQLESREVIYTTPISSEIPLADDSCSYSGKIYRIKT